MCGTWAECVGPGLNVWDNTIIFNVYMKTVDKQLLSVCNPLVFLPHRTKQSTKPSMHGYQMYSPLLMVSF